MQAKQRLGPTLKEESQVILKDLQAFQEEIDRLEEKIDHSTLFNSQLTYSQSQLLLNEFNAEQKRLDKQALDYKQLQALLDSNIVDFSKLNLCRETLKHLHLSWKTIRSALLSFSPFFLLPSERFANIWIK